MKQLLKISATPATALFALAYRYGDACGGGSK